MKNIIILIFLFLFINENTKGQTCDSIIDIYSQIGEELILSPDFNLTAFDSIIHVHWEINGDISHDSIYTINSLSQDDEGTYAYKVEYYSSDTGIDMEIFFCFQVYISEATEDNSPTNEIIIDIENMPEEDATNLKNWLVEEGFSKIDSCLCNSIELWAINSDISDLELESTIKRAEEKTDSDGGKSSRNYFAEPDVPLYCLEESQYSWQIPSPSNNPNNEIINVAILDNGFDSGMFPDNLWAGTSSIGACCGTTDPNGYNALSECDIVNAGEHGTVVASTMASFIPHNIPYQMMNLKAIDQRKGSMFKVACATKYAMRSGVDIINFSMGYYGERSTLLDSIMIEARDSNILVITSSGNGGQGRTNHWPSNYSDPVYGYNNVISVGSSDYSGQQSDFSSNADIYAPGHNLICQGIGNVPVLKSGTSFSTAFVTAAAATYLSGNPTASANSVIDSLTSPYNIWSSTSNPEGLIVLNVNLIDEGNPIQFQEHLNINETISNKRAFDAKISIESTGTLLNGADVSMRAGENIRFLPGFKSNPGSILLATIKSCDENTTARLVQDEIEEQESALATKENPTLSNHELNVVPNPFHGQTAILFDLEETVFVELTIYSALGQKIKTLRSGQYDKGNYQVIFHADNIPSGVYYANLIKGENLITKKIVLR